MANPLEGSVRHHLPSFSVQPGSRSPEVCRQASHWRTAKGTCAFCGTPLHADGSEISPEEEADRVQAV